MAQTAFITPAEQAQVDALVASGLYGEFVDITTAGTFRFTGADGLGHNILVENLASVAAEVKHSAVKNERSAFPATCIVCGEYMTDPIHKDAK